MPDISLMGATYSDVPAVILPTANSGTARFDYTADADATAGDIASGKTAYVNGTKLTGTGGGSSITVEQLNVSAGGTYTAPTGKAYSPVVVPTGSATPPSAISSSGATGSSNGTSVVVSKTVSVTPVVSAGYVASGTAGNVSITMQATDANFVDSNIKSGVSIFGKTGTYAGGGDSKNAQIASGVGRVASTSYTAVSGQSITVAKTGTYNVYWSGWRTSTSGTSGTQLYIGSTAYGSAQTTFNSSYTNAQTVHLSNVSLTKDQVVTVRARSRSTSYYMYVFDLTIIEA